MGLTMKTKTATVYTYNADGVSSDTGVRVPFGKLDEAFDDLFARSADVARVAAFYRGEIVRSRERHAGDVVRWYPVPARRVTYRLEPERGTLTEWLWIGKGQRRAIGRVLVLERLTELDAALIGREIVSASRAGVAAYREHVAAMSAAPVIY
jgi:hypothetical protein